MLFIRIEGTTAKSQGLSQQAIRAIIYAAVIAEAIIYSSSSPQDTQPQAHIISRPSKTSEKSHFTLNLSCCDSQVISRGTAYIKKRLIKDLKLQEGTKESTFHMIIDSKKTH